MRVGLKPQAKVLLLGAVFTGCLIGLWHGFYLASIAGIGALAGLSAGVLFRRRVSGLRSAILAIAGAMILPLVTLPFWLPLWVRDEWSGPPHSFVLDETPPFLREETALEMARRTLLLDGYDVAMWEPTEDGRSASPDGVRDKYLNRNTINPREGDIVFQKRGTDDTRFVNIEVVGRRVETCVSRPK